MNKHDPSSPALAHSTTSHFDPSMFPSIVGQRHGTAHRLVVLIPAASDYTAAIRRISELATESGAQVFFIGLCKNTAHEMSLRRELITLAALLRDAKVSAQASVEIGTNWIDALKNNYRVGDVIVCFADHQPGLLQKPFSQILESNFNIPVYILSGLYPKKHESSVLSQLVAWSGFIGFIICFGALQAQLIQFPGGWLQNVLLILSIILEFWLILVWNNLFS
jgi:hypothetical protein